MFGTVAILSGDSANAHGALVLFSDTAVSPEAVRTAVQKLRAAGGLECIYYDRASHAVTMISRQSIKNILPGFWKLLGVNGAKVVEARHLSS